MGRSYLAVLAWVSFSVAAAAEPPAALLEQFAGAWVSEGVAFGAPARSQMVWAPALDGRFQRIEYRIEMSRESGPSTFEGVGYYQLGNGETLNAFWSDNSGDLHPIRAGREGNALISHWGVEGGKQGRTRYELLLSGDLQVTDWIKTSEGWRQFNQSTFERRQEE
jgi:hypothetical protein